LNIQGYKSIAKSGLTKILSLFNIKKVSFYILDDILGALNSILTSPYDNFIDNSLSNQFLDSDILKHPWNTLYHYLKDLFPLKPTFLKILNVMSFDDHSSKYM